MVYPKYLSSVPGVFDGVSWLIVRSTILHLVSVSAGDGYELGAAITFAIVVTVCPVALTII